MNKLGYQGIFNARWMASDDVAKKFIPIPHFRRLVQSTHSVLLGPRGCGKTTLLKMLTSTAIQTWTQYRRKKFTKNPFEYPDFEAIYIPSDVRWSYELRELNNQPLLDAKRAELIQRAMITISVYTAVIDTMIDVFKYSKELTSDDESLLCKAFIDDWKLKPVIPRFIDIKRVLAITVTDIRGALNYRNQSRIDSILENMQLSLFSHSLDAPVNSCRLISGLIGPKLKHKKWAICFDELEIAPDWLRKEVFESLRSLDNQNIYLKVTCSPLLPSGLISAPEHGEDFKPIRLFFPHVQEAMFFCEELARGFLQTNFKNNLIKPDEFFFQSPLAREDNSEEELRSYERGSPVYRAIIDLAQTDSNFNQLLRDNKINPEDPYAVSVELRDTFLRKIKPFVLLRHAYLKDDRMRSRKVVDVYAGKQAVYAMSEANPRWLLGLLNDLFEKWKTNPKRDDYGNPFISFADQAKVLDNAARRYQAYLAATASSETGNGQGQHKSLLDFLQKVGDAFNYEIYGHKFPLDPAGSFFLDEGATESLVKTVEKALEIGALVFVGKSNDDIPKRVEGERFRLTFMLSPIFKLPFRNYRSASLSSLLKKTDQAQGSLFDKV